MSHRGDRAHLVLDTLGHLLAGELRRTIGVGKLPVTSEDDELVPDSNQLRARAIRQSFERLGPLYIKIGQMLSTRPDLCPDYLRKEFENLHAKVSATPFADFEPVLADELGENWQKYFRDIDTDPVGTASLAQVYRVTLRSGRSAVVKIQRPGIRQAMLDDMAILKMVVRRIAKRFPDFNDVMDLDALLEVVFASMRPELDFTVEGENMGAFRERAAEFDTLAIPDVIYMSPRVIVQSLAPGDLIRDVNKDKFTLEQRAAMGTDLLAFFFWSYFVDRKFHADPHPGNIFISPEGQATIIDWGQVAQMDRHVAMCVCVILIAFSLNDGPSMARAWIEMGRATRRADIAGFIQDMCRFVPGVKGQPLEKFNFGVKLTAVLTFSSKRGIATSPIVAILGKSFANLEGSIRYLAPHLSLTDTFDEEFKILGQALSREMLTREWAGRVGAETLITMVNAPSMGRGLLTDLANRDATILQGEEMSRRSRREDRADARLKKIQHMALGLAAGYLLDRRRRNRNA